MFLLFTPSSDSITATKYLLCHLALTMLLFWLHVCECLCDGVKNKDWNKWWRDIGGRHLKMWACCFPVSPLNYYCVILFLSDVKMFYHTYLKRRALSLSVGSSIISRRNRLFTYIFVLSSFPAADRIGWSSHSWQPESSRFVKLSHRWWDKHSIGAISMQHWVYYSWRIDIKLPWWSMPLWF